MRTINKYILEKLYIGKGFNAKGNSLDVMEEIFKDNDINVLQDPMSDSQVIIKKNDGEKYPYIILKIFKDYWCEGGESEIDTDCLELNIWYGSDDVTPRDASILDIAKNNKGYAYTEKNAEILTSWLKK